MRRYFLINHNQKFVNSFFAPEQYGFHQTDERTDIYSLGLTLKLLLGYENYHGFLSPILAKCIEFDPNKRFDSARSLKRAIIRRKRFHKWKNFITVTCIGIVSLSGYFLFQRTTPFEVPVADNKLSSPEEKIILPESKSNPNIIHVVEEAVTKVPDKSEKIFSADEIIIPPFHYPELKFQPPLEAISEIPKRPTVSMKEIISETAKKVDETTLEPSPQMSRNDFANQMRNLNLSDDKLNAKQDEHHRRLELNQRVEEFMKQLPADMTEQERNDARFSFYQQEKQRLNLK